MTQQILEYHVREAIYELEVGDRDFAKEHLHMYSETVDGDPELLDIFREMVYNYTGEWLE